MAIECIPLIRACGHKEQGMMVKISNALNQRPLLLVFLRHAWLLLLT